TSLNCTPGPLPGRVGRFSSGPRAPAPAQWKQNLCSCQPGIPTMPPRLAVCALTLFLLAVAPAAAQQEQAKSTDAPKPETPPGDKLPFCGLAPSKLQPNLCLLKYRISTTSPA